MITSLRFILLVFFSVFLLTTLQTVAGSDTIDRQVEKMSRQYDKKYSTIKHITVAFYLQHQKDWLLVDVRAEKERKISIISGAITVTQLENNSAHYKNKNILLYCTIGERSSVYALKLNKLGWKNTANLRGGVLAWALNGQNFVTPDNKKTNKVHVYAAAWNLLPVNYIGVW
jgi:rhodanese-related sulfurtransferase